MSQFNRLTRWLLGRAKDVHVAGLNRTIVGYYKAEVRAMNAYVDASLIADALREKQKQAVAMTRATEVAVNAELEQIEGKYRG